MTGFTREQPNEHMRVFLQHLALHSQFRVTTQELTSTAPGATDSDRKHRSQLCHHVVSGHRFTVTSLAYTLHTHEYMHSFQAYPPSDSNALRGEGFQLHVLRWSIRSWGHSTNINIMNCTLDPNNCLKQQHVSQHPAEQMSRCESHSAYFTKCGSCFYR